MSGEQVSVAVLLSDLSADKTQSAIADQLLGVPVAHVLGDIRNLSSQRDESRDKHKYGGRHGRASHPAQARCGQCAGAAQRLD